MAYNILVVDDSFLVRDVITKTLHICGAPVKQVFHAANGREALQILADNWIDLVFCDINMPVMNGIEMLEKMVDDGILKSIPVVIISTEGSATRIEQLRLKGVRGYIRKPFVPEAIREIINEILGDSKINNSGNEQETKTPQLVQDGPFAR